jgi:hypothetical protein
MERTILAAVAFVCALGAKSFTLEQVMSAPFPSELTAAPGGGKVAYRTLLRGAPAAGVSGGLTYDAVIATCARKERFGLTNRTSGASPIRTS